MEARTVVAIEIASSKIKGGIASVDPDGRITVLAVEEIQGNNNVRYGRVQNIREVEGMVNEIIRKLEKSPAISPATVSAIAIGFGGRSLEAMPVTAALKFPNDSEITEQHVERLKYEAMRDFTGDKEIVGTIPRVFSVNGISVPKAVGTYADSLKGEFMLVTCGRDTMKNLHRLKIEGIDPDDIKYILRPTAVADLILNADERELGCALVDFGAETTTVSVYKDGTMAFLCSIPMGSRLITLDLMTGLGITEDSAETYKLTLGTLADSTDQNTNPNAEEVNGYVRARAGEIAANILNQIERSGIPAAALSKIVLTGGGSKLPEFAAELGQQCKQPVRIADMPTGILFRTAGRNNADNIDIVALLEASARVPYFNCIEQPRTTVIETPADILNIGENDTEPLKESPTVSVPNVVEPSKPGNPFNADKRSRILDEDDEELLNDDDDDAEATQKKQGKKPFKIFTKLPKNEEVEAVEDDDIDSTNYIDEDDPDNYKRTTGIIQDLGRKFVNIFKQSTSSDNDDDDL
jgi:cell division protein FtsA